MSHLFVRLEVVKSQVDMLISREVWPSILLLARARHGNKFNPVYFAKFCISVTAALPFKCSPRSSHLSLYVIIAVDD